MLDRVKTHEIDEPVLCQLARLGWAQVSNFLSAELAEAAYQEMACREGWDCFLLSEGRKYLASAPTNRRFSEVEMGNICERANASAAAGRLSAVYEIEPRKAEAAALSTGGRAIDTILCFLKSLRFLNILREAFRRDVGSHVDLQIQRHQPGHFITYHRGFIPTNPYVSDGVAFFYNLTPEWKPEWGGLLTFRGRNGGETVSLTPVFNSLDLCAHEKGRWFTPIAPFASGPKFVIAGSTAHASPQGRRAPIISEGLR